MPGEFLVQHYPIPLYAITMVISIFTYSKYFDTALRFFPIIIAYTFFNELLGYFIRYTDNYAFFSQMEYANDVIYNLYDLIFFGFFYFVYGSLIKSSKYRKWIVWCAMTVGIAYAISLFFQNPLTTVLFYALSIASWGLLFCVVLYFLDKKTWNWNLEKYNLMAWVSIGLGAFYFFFPILYLIGFLKYDVWQQYNLRTVLRMLIVIMYVLFCIGFIKSRRRAFG